MLGTIFLAIGAIGVVVPGLPTTPFLLLSAALFLRSSERLHRRLLSSRIFGRIVSGFHERGGMTYRAKAAAISVMWAMIALSVTLLRPLVARVIVVGSGVVGTVVMGFVVRTVRGTTRPDEDG